MKLKGLTSYLTVTAVLAVAVGIAAAAPKIKVLIVDGQNNHGWAKTTPVMKEILEGAGIFQVDVATSPPKGKPMGDFKPDFAKYGVVLSNYNGADWPEATRDAFVKYMRDGGGLVVVHAADNAFPRWKEYNEMIAVGGWGGRNEKSGPMVRYRDGKVVLDTSPGRGGTHGPQHAYQIIMRDRSHPVAAGLPEKWMHAKDELYSKLRGPAKNLTVIGTAFADAKKRGTGEHEPALMDIRFGKGRIFHTILGHAAGQMKCVGFIVTLQRGTEWAATGKVTLKVPADFPTADKVTVRSSPLGKAPKAAAPTPAPAPDDLITYTFSKSRAPLAAVEASIRGATPAKRAAIEKGLLAAMNNPQATYDCKQFVCRMLRRIGTKRSVPALAKLLLDAKLSHMARFALERMSCDEAGVAIRGALTKVDGKLKIGMITSLGARRDRKAVAAIAALIGGGDPVLAAAAVGALGRIGGSEAAKTLVAATVPVKLQATRDDACLLCADSLVAEGKAAEAAPIYRSMADGKRPAFVRIAACRGLLRAEPGRAAPIVLGMFKGKDPAMQRAAGQLISSVPGAEATRTFARELESLPPAVQVALLSALTVRGDKAAAPFVVKAVASNDASVRIAAIRALAVVGDASAVLLLATKAADEGDVGRAASESLQQITGPGVSAALGKIVAGWGTAAVRIKVIDALAARRDASALDAMFKAAASNDAGVRKSAVKAVGAVAGPKDLPRVVAMLVANKNPAQSLDLERAVVSVAGRIKDPDARTAPIVGAILRAATPGKVALLGVLSRLGGQKACRVVRGQLRSRTPEVKTAAIRALSDWPDPSGMQDLLGVAKTDPVEVNRILAMRGYIRLVAMPANRSAKDTARLLAGAMASAKRKEDKIAILAVLPKCACKETLALAESCAKDPQVAAEAALAVRKVKGVLAAGNLKATASHGNADAAKAVDKNNGTRWTSGKPMTPGMWFTIDIGFENDVKRIVLDTTGSREDYPRGYEVYVSFDGKNWGDAVLTGKGKGPVTELVFKKPVLARFVKIVQTGGTRRLNWSIHELKIEFK